jgi:hypothetical protein
MIHEALSETPIHLVDANIFEDNCPDERAADESRFDTQSELLFVDISVEPTRLTAGFGEEGMRFGLQLNKILIINPHVKFIIEKSHP